MSGIWGFPNSVNEKAARVVAIGVVAISVLALLTGWYWLLAVMAAGFWLRVFTGPSIDPLAMFATRVAAPRLGRPVPTPGPPKRFAQTIGAVLTTIGAISAIAFGFDDLATAVLLVMTVFASLEGFLNICVGCRIFSLLMKTGIIPERICLECADLSRRYT